MIYLILLKTIIKS